MEVSVVTIKEVEEQTGLTRSNIRFYEKEKLIEPLRNDKNGYRDYSEKDVENIKKLLICAHWKFLLKIFVVSYLIKCLCISLEITYQVINDSLLCSFLP